MAMGKASARREGNPGFSSFHIFYSQKSLMYFKPQGDICNKRFSLSRRFVYICTHIVSILQFCFNLNNTRDTYFESLPPPNKHRRLVKK